MRIRESWKSAAWACGEHESNRDEVVDALIALAGGADDALVREAAVASLGAIGDERAVGVIIAACSDKPAVRRRAVLALAPFEGDAVEADDRARPRGPRLAGPPGRRGPPPRPGLNRRQRWAEVSQSSLCMWTSSGSSCTNSSSGCRIGTNPRPR